MAMNIKGITVEINGDTTKLQHALNNVKAQTSGLTKAMAGLGRAMKIDPYQLDNLALQAELSSMRMSDLAKQAGLVQTAINDFPNQVKNWEIGLERAKQKQSEIALKIQESSANMDKLGTVYFDLISSQQKLSASISETNALYVEEKSLLDMFGAELREQQGLYADQLIKVQELQSKLVTEEATLSKLKAEIDSITTSYISQKEAVAQTETLLKTEEAELKRISSDITVQTEQMMEKRAYVESIKNNLEIENSKLLSIEQTLGRTSQAYAEQDIKVMDMQRQLNMESSILTEMQSKVDSLRRSYNDQDIKVREIRKQLADQKLELKETYKTASKLADTYNKQKREVENTQQNLKKETKELERIAKEKGKATLDYREQETLVQSINNKLIAQQKELSEIGFALFEAKLKLEDEVKVTKELVSEEKKQQAAIESNTRQLENQKQSMASMRVEASKLRAEFNKIAGSSLGNNSLVLGLYGSLEVTHAMAEKVYDKLKMISIISGAGLLASVGTAISFESAWAGVTKTVNGTSYELDRVNEGLKDLATRTNSSYQDIAHFAELAGQMGVATNDIVTFTKTITELNDTTNLVGDEAAQSLAKIKNIFHGAEQQEMDYYERMGSAIVHLGNNMATTEQDIVNMAETMGSYTHLAGFTEQQTLAMAATLSSLGIQAQAGGSSIGKLVENIESAVSNGVEAVGDFAEAAGVSAQEFYDAWKKDPSEAFATLFEGLGTVENLNKVLGELGIQNIRVTRTAKSLTSASDLLREALGLSTTAWEENTAMEEEAAKRYDTTAAKLRELWESVKQVASELGEQFLPAIKNIVDGTKNFVQGFSKMDDGTKKLITNALLATTALAPLAKVFSLASGAGMGLIKLFNNGFRGVGAIATRLGVMTDAVSYMTVGMTKAERATYLASASFKGYKVSMSALFTALKAKGASGVLSSIASQFGALSLAGKAAVSVIGVGGALAVGYVALKKYVDSYTKSVKNSLSAESEQYNIAKATIEKNKELEKSINEKRQATEDYANSVKDNEEKSEDYLEILEDMMTNHDKSTGSIEKMKAVIDQLNEMYPNLNWHIEEETGKIIDNTGAVMNNTEELKKNLEEQQKTYAKQAYSNAMASNAEAMVDQEIAMKGLTKEISATEQEWQKYFDLQHEALESGDQAAARDYGYKVKELADVIHELTNENEQYTESMKKMKYEQRELQNATESLDISKFGDTLKENFTSLKESAKEFGYNIPAEIQKGLDGGDVDVEASLMWQDTLVGFSKMRDLATANGTAIDDALASGIVNKASTVEESIQYLNNLSNYQAMLTSAGVAGKEIPAVIAENIANGSIGIDEATRGLANYVNLKPLVEQAGKGNEFTDELVQSILSGKTSLEQAAKQLGVDLPQGLEDGQNEAVTNTEENIKKITDAVKKGDLKKEGKQMGQSFKDSILKEFKEAHGGVKSWLSEIKKEAGQNITLNVKVNKSEDKSGGAGANFQRNPTVYKTKISTAYGDGINSSLMALTNTISDQLFGTDFGKQLTRSAIDTSMLDKMVNKLDNVINSLMDANIVIQLQPQELDGREITDAVEEVQNIRTLLNNYGKGVA